MSWWYWSRWGGRWSQFPRMEDEGSEQWVGRLCCSLCQVQVLFPGSFHIIHIRDSQIPSIWLTKFKNFPGNWRQIRRWSEGNRPTPLPDYKSKHSIVFDTLVGKRHEYTICNALCDVYIEWPTFHKLARNTDNLVSCPNRFFISG